MSIIGLNTLLKKILTAQPSGDVSDISFAQPSRDWSASLTRPTINCWLFQIEENVLLRSMEQTISSPERIKTKREPSRNEKYPDEVTVAHIRYAPRRFDFSYLVTAWSNETEDEHKLLWRALSLFNRSPIIGTQDLEGELANQPYDIPIAVARAADTGLSMSDLWSVLDNHMRPGFIITSTLALDPRQPYDDQVTLVEEAYVTVGQSSQKEPQEESITTEKPDVQVEKYPPDKDKDPLYKDRHLINKSPIETIDTTIRWKPRPKSDSNDNQ